ncbi:ead/Ea22-like family protein [Citrobacter freundii]|uniref:ead/Ea22-like family protein n=1 Tax=Citrobacter freundii TaxID=546 RepID=UPI00335EF7C4
MTALNKQALRSKARSASAGEWIKESGDGWEAICSSDDQANGNFIIAHFEGPDAKENREFVQVANPAAVLTLLGENESMACDLISRNGEIEGLRQRIAELEANQGKPVMFIDGDISPAGAEKLAAVIREFNEDTETPAARMARIIRENPHPTNMCDMPAAGIGVKGV